MPRANLTTCFDEQRTLRDGLLSSVEGAAIVAAVREMSDGQEQGLPAHKLGKLLNVPARNLKARFAVIHTGQQSAFIAEDAALEAVRQYLPRALGWRTVADVAKEIDEHRNTVESVVRQFGEPGMLLVTPDHKMYVSPRGEEIVREQQEKRRIFSSYDRLTDVAKELQIPQNLARSFFHNRKIQLDTDLHGRLRVSPEQKSDLIRWRTVVSAWRNSDDLTINGTTYRAIRTLAQEKAALLEPHGSTSFQARTQREETALRYFCHCIRKPAASDKLNQYVSADIAKSFLETISLHEAARLALVSESTIKHWRTKFQELTPSPIPGKKTTGVSLPALLDVIRTKYEQETKLAQRTLRPACVITLPLQAVASKAGVPFEPLVETLSISRQIKHQLLLKKGAIPKQGYRKLASDLSIESAWQHAQGSRFDAINYLLEVFKPSSPVASPTVIQGAVETAAFRRGVSAHQVYADAVSLFRISDVWPQTFDNLRSGSRDPLFFPLSFLCYLSALADPRRKVFQHPICVARDKPQKGDILTIPALMDFGIITAVTGNEYRTVLRVALTSGRRVATFEVS